MNVEEFYAKILCIKSPWFILQVRIEEYPRKVIVEVNHKEGMQFSCKCCSKQCSVYDHQKKRLWRHLDTCNYDTYLEAYLPRIKCPTCGIKTVEPSWSRSNSHFTLDFESHALDVLQQVQVLSRSALLLRISESQLSTIRDAGIQRGLARRKVNMYCVTTHLCIDEKSLKKGHNYVTILYDGTTGGVLEVVEHRTKEATNELFTAISDSIDLSKVEVVTMDMWQAFKNAVQNSVPQADIVYDRFHLAQYLNNAVDITRRAENKRLRKNEDHSLKSTKYIWLKNADNFTEKQAEKHQELLCREELDTVQAWKLKEEFKQFFLQEDVLKAALFFESWTDKVIQLGNKPLKKVATMMVNHWVGIIAYAKHRVSNAMAESVNSSIQLIKAKARGFNSANAFRKTILFHLGKLDIYP